MEGESVISHGLTARIVEDIRDKPSLSSREIEVVRLIAKDLIYCVDRRSDACEYKYGRVSQKEHLQKAHY